MASTFFDCLSYRRSEELVELVRIHGDIIVENQISNYRTIEKHGLRYRTVQQRHLNRSCVNAEQSCNCDISEAKWLSDEGYYISPDSLGITKMVFLQQKDLDEDALGRITLGPLECVETNTQKYVVTFTSSQSYIEVPGWTKGDIAFSFRTTGEKAILLYQPPIRPHQPSFMVALTSEFHLTFNFTMNTGKPRALAIKSSRRLNSGEWQKIWIDYNQHHVRFMINTDYQMVDLLPEEEFGPFEGSMFIGGATELRTCCLGKKLDPLRAVCSLAELPSEFRPFEGSMFIGGATE
ncbi:hypothetical protein J6590_049693 [Homalodisca vitripennis]|nr:hypothetical protein J6590_049693 [Homalodisca vitripennis]